MGGEYPKGGRWGGAIFLGYSPPRDDIPRNIAPLWGGGRISWGGESPVTTAWANSSTFLKILSCPPKYEFAPQMPPPPNSEAWRRHCFYLCYNLLSLYSTFMYVCISSRIIDVALYSCLYMLYKLVRNSKLYGENTDYFAKMCNEQRITKLFFQINI